MTTRESQQFNELREKNHKLIELQMTVMRNESTIRTLVRIVDELRQPYNNSKRHDLYLMATNKLNELEDREELPTNSSWIV